MLSFKMSKLVSPDESLQKHQEYCNMNEAIKIEMLKKGSILSFNNYVRAMRVPFIVYTDFETMIKLIDICRLNPEMSYIKQYQKHVPVSF